MAKTKTELHLVEQNDYRLLEKVLSKGTQDVTYREIFSLNQRKFKIVIESDSYLAQCHARVYALEADTLKWNVVYYIHYSNMKTPKTLYVVQKSENELFALFKADRDQLMAMLKEILN